MCVCMYVNVCACACAWVGRELYLQLFAHMNQMPAGVPSWSSQQRTGSHQSGWLPAVLTR